MNNYSRLQYLETRGKQLPFKITICGFWGLISKIWVGNLMALCKWCIISLIIWQSGWKNNGTVNCWMKDGYRFWAKGKIHLNEHDLEFDVHWSPTIHFTLCVCGKVICDFIHISHFESRGQRFGSREKNQRHWFVIDRLTHSNTSRVTRPSKPQMTLLKGQDVCLIWGSRYYNRE